MRKVLSIALILFAATIAVPAAQAEKDPLGKRIIAQENAKDVGHQPTPTSVHPVLAQERGRHADARLFGPANAAPVQVFGSRDGFDLGDAGIGGAAALALALLAAAGVALRSNRRQETGAAVAES